MMQTHLNTRIVDFLEGVRHRNCRTKRHVIYKEYSNDDFDIDLRRAYCDLRSIKSSTE